MKTFSPCGVYNIGNSKTTTLNDFIKICEKTVGKTAIVKQVPEKLGDVPITYSDVTLANKDFGYEPTTDLEEGLKKTFEWLKPVLDKQLENST